MGISAGLSFLTTLPAVIAVSSGIRRGNMLELSQNLAINAGGILGIGLLIRRDLDNQKNRLERIQRGGALASLQLQISSEDSKEPLIIKLSDLRRDRGIEKRVVIVAAPKNQLKTSLLSSISFSSDLTANDLLVVPLMIDTEARSNAILSGSSDLICDILGEKACEQTMSHLGSPVDLRKWNEVVQKELENALKQDVQALDKGITLVIKKNGKVGSRRLGVPIWEALMEDVQIRKNVGLDTTNI